MDRAEYEDAIDADSVPLRAQVDFMRQALGKGGPYFNLLRSASPDPAEMSIVYRYVSIVSARMTLAYHRHEKLPGMESVFDISRLSRSTLPIHFTSSAGLKAYCNGFFARSGGEVFFLTDAHCVRYAADPGPYFVPDDPRMDIAVRRAANEVPNPETILQLDDAVTDESIAGRVSVSYSWGPDGTEKVDFSFAMPFARKLYLSVHDKSPLKIDGFVVMRPPEESLRKLDAQGRPTALIRGSGSSGSPVGVLMDDGRYHLGGNLLQNTVHEDTCQHLCYSVGVIQKPGAVKEAITAARMFRDAGRPQTMARGSTPTVEGWSARVESEVPKAKLAKRPRKD